MKILNGDIMYQEQEDSVIQALCDGRAVYFKDENGDLFQLVSTREREEKEKREIKRVKKMNDKFWSKCSVITVLSAFGCVGVSSLLPNPIVGNPNYFHTFLIFCGGLVGGHLGYFLTKERVRL